LFCFGNTEEEVKKKAERIYIYIEHYLQKEKTKTFNKLKDGKTK